MQNRLFTEMDYMTAELHTILWNIGLSFHVATEINEDT